MLVTASGPAGSRCTGLAFPVRTVSGRVQPRRRSAPRPARNRHPSSSRTLARGGGHGRAAVVVVDRVWPGPGPARDGERDLRDRRNAAQLVVPPPGLRVRPADREPSRRVDDRVVPPAVRDASSLTGWTAGRPPGSRRVPRPLPVHPDGWPAVGLGRPGERRRPSLAGRDRPRPARRAGGGAPGAGGGVVGRRGRPRCACGLDPGDAGGGGHPMGRRARARPAGRATPPRPGGRGADGGDGLRDGRGRSAARWAVRGRHLDVPRPHACACSGRGIPSTMSDARR